MVLCGWRASQSQSLSGGGLLRLAETVLLLATAGVLLRASPYATACFLESKFSQGVSPSFEILHQLPLLLLKIHCACSKALTAAVPVNRKGCGCCCTDNFHLIPCCLMLQERFRSGGKIGSLVGPFSSLLSAAESVMLPAAKI